MSAEPPTTDRYQPTDAEGGLVFAVRLPGGPPGEAGTWLGWDELDAIPDAGEPPIWIHLDRTRPRAQAWLRDRAGIPEIVADSLLAESTRPQTVTAGPGLLVILRGLNLNVGAEPDELIAIRLWLEPGRIITLRQFRFRTVADLRRQCEQDRGPATPGELLADLATGLSTRLAPSVDNLEEMIDAVEEAMLDGGQVGPRAWGELGTVRRQAISYRRSMVPQREALSALAQGSSPLLRDVDRLELRAAAERTARICESLEEQRDRAAVTQEELRGRREERLGRTVYVLTVISAIALPLALITGMLGMNVGGIPLAESGAGFAVVCAVMAGIAIGEYALLRAMRWL